MIRKSGNRFSEKIMLQQEQSAITIPPERIALYSIRRHRHSSFKQQA
jgi:hypothetical protein